MIRTNFITSIASALGAMTLFTTAAQACISCQYVPEVINASKDDSRHSYRPEVSYSAKIEMRERMARAQAAKAHMANVQAAKMNAAKARAAAQKIETGSLPQKNDETDAKPVNTASTPAASDAKREKPFSTATLLVGESVSTEAESGRAVECKKFVAAIGTTVTVPCK